MFKQIQVNTLSKKKYFYRIGTDLMDGLTDFVLENYPSQKVNFVFDENFYSFHGKKVENHFKSKSIQFNSKVIQAGEKSKSFEEFAKLVDVLLDSEIERNSPLIAFGGGVIGDLAGFAAASVLRGIPLIHVPTTVLAMVDSSIGGKTGINHRVGKNLVGAFYQPDAIFADLNFLSTLAEKEWINGLSEIIKYGFIANSKILETLNNLISETGFKNPSAWMEIIELSANIKIGIVEKDTLEKGKREFLNFGHTFAHVIENVSGYGIFSHGEAVFMGMWAASKVAEKMGYKDQLTNLSPFRSLYTCSLSNLEINAEQLTELMIKDKKTKNNKIRLVLIKKMEHPFTQQFEDKKPIIEAWNSILKEFS